MQPPLDSLEISDGVTKRSDTLLGDDIAGIRKTRNGCEVKK